MTEQEHAKHMIEIAQFAMGKIRAMKIGKEELAAIDLAWDNLSKAKNLINRAK